MCVCVCVCVCVEHQGIDERMINVNFNYYFVVLFCLVCICSKKNVQRLSCSRKKNDISCVCWVGVWRGGPVGWGKGV